MLRRVIVKPYNTKGIFFSNEKFAIVSHRKLHIKVIQGCRHTGACLTFQKINFTESRFCSTSSVNYVKKIFTLNAESPDPQSSSTASEEIEYIPPPPEPPEILEETLNNLNSLGESTLQSLGLGGWSPVGLIQQAIEFMHVSIDLPWWGAIACTTAFVRFCLFPLVIVSQRNSSKMFNAMPQLSAIQTKMTEARNSGNNLEAARLAYELEMFMKKNDIQPFKNMILPIAQAPIFISMFIGLRRCANLPVESFQTGGMFWFTDLTIADPYYMLPLLTSLTLLCTIELGTEGQSLNNQSPLVRYGFRALPIIIFPFTLSFPSAILCYWLSSNLCSLLQVGFLKIPKVRKYFNIDQKVKRSKDLSGSKKGFVASAKESWSNMKVSTEIRDRQRVDEMKFKKAGMGPLVKTYKHNPLKKEVINIRAKVKN